jgi:hypothetical protein
MDAFDYCDAYAANMLMHYNFMSLVDFIYLFIYLFIYGHHHARREGHRAALLIPF